MKNSKKIVAILLALVLAVAGVFVACSKKPAENNGAEDATATEATANADFKVGFI